MTHTDLRKDAADSSSSGTNGYGSHNKEVVEMVGVGAVVGVATDVVVEEAITTPHKPMTMPTSEEQEYGQVLLL